MIKVAVFIPRYYPIFGGAENQARLLNRYLIDSKKVSIPFVVTHRMLATLAKEECIDGVKVKRLGFPGSNIIFNLFFLISSSIFFIKHHRKFDLIHSHASSVPGFFVTLVGVLINKPVILKLSTNGELQHNPKSILKSFLRKWMIKFMAKNANFVCLNQEGFVELENIMAINKYFIPNGIDFACKHHHLTKKDLGFNEEDIVIIFVGRFVKRKGIDTLLSAFKLLLHHEHSSKVKILLLGSSENQSDSVNLELMHAQGLMDHRILIKHALPDEVIQYLLMSDIFVSCSHREGMPNVVLEAISAGLPCILSDIKPHAEIVASCTDDQGLFLFPTGDACELKNMLLNLIDQKVYKEKYFSRLPNKYNIESVAQEYVDLYEQLILNNGS